ncbi:MAG: 3-oxoacyl-ACP reductase [Chloroflexi bacterium]|nr:3-oxoacyl-ACP reductase [Chloroflexota bacterium]|tara:strand:+ start:1617 stop:2399 length:783 start_codon:yes stop_codon:yes gene_type:complete
MALLEGKNAIITGAGSGIGKETAKLFAKEGCNLVLSGRRKEPLIEVKNHIHNNINPNLKIFVEPTDLENLDEAKSLGQNALKFFGKIHILVNNAGHSSFARSIRFTSDEEWESVFKVNADGVFKLTQSVIENMIDNKNGTIITVSSIAALNPGLLGGASYSSAKAASLALMRSINSELNDRGIRTSTIMPAEVDTPILKGRPINPDNDARSTMMMPEDVANTILLCATMPQRTVIQEVVMAPIKDRDRSKEIEAARKAKL